MTLRFRGRRRAKLEVDEAFAWYELRAEGLGDALLRAPAQSNRDRPGVEMSARLLPCRQLVAKPDPLLQLAEIATSSSRAPWFESRRAHHQVVDLPPLSCFRIILLSDHSAGCSFASRPRSRPPSAAEKMQRPSGRADGCVRSAEEGGPPAPQSLPVCGSCDAVAARVLNVCVRDFARARRRRAPSTGSLFAEETWTGVRERKGNAPPRTSQ